MAPPRPARNDHTTHQVTIFIVDRLESIDVGHRNREGSPKTRRSSKLREESLVEFPPIRQPRQGIRPSQPLQLFVLFEQIPLCPYAFQLEVGPHFGTLPLGVFDDKDGGHPIPRDSQCLSE